jgi:hypothetical protein
MSATPPVGPTCTLSVMNCIASMPRDMKNAPTPPAAAAAQLLYYEEQISGPSPAVKVEREVGLGTFGLPGRDTNGVSLVFLSLGNRIGRDRL